MTNFSGPVTVPWGCWRLLSLRLNHRKLPVNVMTTVVLVTSIGLSLEIPLRVRTGSKVRCLRSCSFFTPSFSRASFGPVRSVLLSSVFPVSLSHLLHSLLPSSFLAHLTACPISIFYFSFSLTPICHAYSLYLLPLSCLLCRAEHVPGYL